MHLALMFRRTSSSQKQLQLLEVLSQHYLHSHWLDQVEHNYLLGHRIHPSHR